MKIKTTKNYKMFKRIRGNRNVSDVHVNNIIKSLAESNLLEFLPIVVNKNNEVIDGQHRLEAAKKVGAFVSYVYFNDAQLSEVQEVNTNVRPWAPPDYLQSYLDLGYREYETLANFVQTYGLPITLSVRLLTDNRANVLGLFKSGKMHITRLDEAQQLAARLNDFKHFMPGTGYKDSTFISAIRTAYEHIDHAKLINKLKRRNIKLQRRGTVRDYLRDIEDIYNYKLQEDQRVKLY